MTQEGTAEGTAAGVAATPEKAVRKTVGPMTVRIGKWDETKTVFTVLATLVGPTDKEIKKAVQALGYGTYALITGRDTTAVLAKKETDSFTL